MSTELFKSFARLHSLRSQEELHTAEVLAKLDQHNTIAPTHIVRKDGLIIGHFSIAAIPVWMAHLSKVQTHPHDTFRLVHIAENTMEARGMGACLALIGKESGLHSKMLELGYNNTGNADVFLKQF